VDLYAGAGGMSLGLEKYFDVKWVVDNDHMAAATLRANKINNNVQIYTEDVGTFLKNCAKGNPCYPKAGQVKHRKNLLVSMFSLFVLLNKFQPIAFLSTRVTSL
jgi:site-specific DNA-cytosine methylase